LRSGAAGAGPADGSPLEAILVLGTLGAPERRRLRGRRGRMVEGTDPAPVPTTRATVVRPEPFADGAGEAERWVADLRGDREAADAVVDAAIAVVNRGVRAYRLAAADAFVTPAAPGRALVVRIGYGDGKAVADGLATQSWELPSAGHRRRVRSMEAPEERFAAILGGRKQALACEELVLRACTDLRAGQAREAALEARVALEALLAELPETGAALADGRQVVADAANAALEGPLIESLVKSLSDVLVIMERLLRNRRLTT
jgi:hypothetical protein